MTKKIRKQKPRPKAISNQLPQKVNSISAFIKKKKTTHPPFKRQKNRYTFTSFTQRMKSIDVKSHGYRNYMQSIHNRDTDHIQQDMTSSQLMQFLDQQRISNNSIQFANLVHDLMPYIGNYIIVFRNKDSIISVLKQTYQEDQGLRKSVIGCLISLLKDCRDQLFDQFKALILPIIINGVITNSNDIELLDLLFTLLCYALKFLSKKVNQHFQEIYKQLFPLIMHKNQNIKRFVAQAIGYVLKACENAKDVINKLIQPIFSPLDYVIDPKAIVDDSKSQYQEVQAQDLPASTQNTRLKTTFENSKLSTINFKPRIKQQICDGISNLLAELSNSTKSRQYLKILVRKVASKQQNIFLLCILRLVIMKTIIQTDNTLELLGFIAKKFRSIKDSSHTSKYYLLTLIKDAIQYKNGLMISDDEIASFLYKLVHKIAQDQNQGSQIKFQLIQVLAMLWSKKLTLCQNFMIQKQQQSHGMNKYFRSCWIFDLFGAVHFLSLFCFHSIIWEYDLEVSNSNDYYKIPKPFVFDKRFSKAILVRFAPSFIDLLERLGDDDEQINFAQDLFDRILSILVQIDMCMDGQKLIPLPDYLVHKFLQILSGKDQTRLQIKFQCSYVLLRAYSDLIENDGKLIKFDSEEIKINYGSHSYFNQLDVFLFCSGYQLPQKYFQYHIQSNYLILRGQSSKWIELLYKNNYFLKQIQNNNISIEQYDASSLIPIFTKNLSSNNHLTRLYSLKILKNLSNINLQTNILSKLIEIESAQLKLQTDKLITSKLQYISNYLSKNQSNDNLYDLLWHYILGIFWIKYENIFDYSQAIIAMTINRKPQIYLSKLLNILSQFQQLTQLDQQDHQSLKQILSDDEWYNIKDPFLQQTFSQLMHYQSDDIKYQCNGLFDYFQYIIKVFQGLDCLQNEAQIKQLCDIFIQFLKDQFSRFYFVPIVANDTDKFDIHSKNLKKRANLKLQWYLRAILSCKSLPSNELKKTLSDVFQSIISQKDQITQSLAIKCQLKFIQTNLLPHQNTLLNFASRDKFKDQIIDFQAINQENYPPELSQFIIRILYQKITQGKIQGAQKNIQVRRKIIFNFIGSFGDRDIRKFVDIWLSSLGLRMMDQKKLKSIIQNTKPQILIGFLKATGLMLEKMKKVLEPYALQIGMSLLQILKAVIELNDQQDGNSKESQYRRKTLKELKKLSFARCYEIMDTHLKVAEGYQFSKKFAPQFVQIFHKSFWDSISNKYTKSDSYLIKILLLFSDRCIVVFRDFPHILDNIIALGLNPETISCVAFSILQIIQNLTQSYDILLKNNNSNKILQIIKIQLKKSSSSSASSTSQQIRNIIFDILIQLTKVPQFSEDKQLLQIAFPLIISLIKKKQNFNTLKNILNTLKNISLTNDNHTILSSKDNFNQLCQLLISVKQIQMRQIFVQFLVDIFSLQFAKDDILLILKQMNMMQRGRADSPIDLQNLIKGCNAVYQINYSDYCQRQIQLIIHQMIFCLSVQDYAVQLVVQKVFEKLIDYLIQSKMFKMLREQIIAKIQSMLVSNVKSESICKQITFIFGYYFRACKALGEIQVDLPYLDLIQYIFKDQSQTTILELLFSIQLPIRIKNLCNLKQIFKKLSQSTLINLIIPLLRCLFERSLSRQRQISQKKESLQAHFLKQILNSYTLISKHMTLAYLFNLLRSLSIKLKNADDTESSKIQCKLICALIEGIPGLGNVFNQRLQLQSQQLQDQNKKSQKLKAFITKLQNYILPSLYKQLKGGQNPHIKYYVIIAIYRIISGLDDIEKAQNHLSRLLHILSSALSSRQQLVRNKVRQALQQFIKVLPPHMLYLVFQSLSSSLVKGFQRHVLNFTIFQLLQNINLHSKRQNYVYAKHIDRCLPYIIPTLREQLFGSLQEQKTTSQSLAAKSYKQAKSSKGIECFELLSSMIEFASNAGTLIQPFQDILTSSPSTRQINKCYDTFQVIILGFCRNPSMQSEQALMFIYSLGAKAFQIQNKILQIQKSHDNQQNVDIQQRKLTTKQLKADKLAVQQGGGSQRRVSIIRAKHKPKSVLISIQAIECFSLNLFYQLLQKHKISFQQFIKNDSIVSQFRQLVLRAIESKSERVIQTAYKLIFIFLKHNLLNPDTKSQLIQHCLQHLNLFDSRYNQEMLQLIVKIINQCLKQYSTTIQNFRLQEPVLEQIITVINCNVQYSEKKVPALFELIKTIIKQKYIQSSIYDLIEVITKIMVQSYDAKTRDMCSEIFLLFLMNYPLEESRINQHINFLLKNLNYPGIDGRMQVLKVLKNVISKVGGEVLNPTRSETIFMFLSLQFANQKEDRCREGVVDNLKAMLQQVGDSEVLGKVVNTMILWRQSEKNRVFSCRLFSLLLRDDDDDDDDDVAGSFKKVVEKKFFTKLVQGCVNDLQQDNERLVDCINQIKQIDRAKIQDEKQNQISNEKAQVLIKHLQDDDSGGNEEQDFYQKDSLEKFRSHIQLQITVMLELVTLILKKYQSQSKKFVSERYMSIITLIIDIMPIVSDNFYCVMEGLDLIAQSVQLLLSKKQKKRNKKRAQMQDENSKSIGNYLIEHLEPLMSINLNLFYSKFKSADLTEKLITNIKVLSKLSQDRAADYLIIKCNKIFSLILGDEKIAKIQGVAFIQLVKQVFLEDLLQDCSITDSKMRDNVKIFIFKCIYQVTSDQEHYQRSQLMDECEKLLELLKNKLRADEFSELIVKVRKEINDKRAQRRLDSEQVKLLKPQKAALKRIKKHNKKKEQKKRKIDLMIKSK